MSKETKTEQNEFQELYTQIKESLSHYCDSAKGEEIKIDDSPENDDFATISIWSEKYDQDQTEEAKLKLAPEKLKPEHQEILAKEGFIWDKALRAWVY